MISICAVLLTSTWPTAFYKSILAVNFWQKLVELVVLKLKTDAYAKPQVITYETESYFMGLPWKINKAKE